VLASAIALCLILASNAVGIEAESKLGQVLLGLATGEVAVLLTVVLRLACIMGRARTRAQFLEAIRGDGTGRTAE
jgi:hypothetical protein